MNAFLIFCLKIFEYTLGFLFYSLRGSKKRRYNFTSLSNIDKVKYLEKRRQLKGYKQKWLYYRCRDEKILDAYYKLFPHEKVITTNRYDDIEFTFGKYKGKLVEYIWNSDKNYIEWLRDNVDLSRYPNEEYAIEQLLNAEVS